MKKVILEVCGIFMVLTGFIFMINYFSGMTGYTVMEEVEEEFSSITSLILIVGGLMFFIIGRHQKISNGIKINPQRGMRRIKFALSTKNIDYKKLKHIVKEIGYKFVEAKEYATVFNPDNKIIKNGDGYPITIPYDKKNDKKILFEILNGIKNNFE